MRRYAVLLLLLSAIWGASYLFIKVAVRDLDPAAMVELRLVLAAPILLGYLALRGGGIGQLSQAIRPGIVLGAVNVAIPYTLIAWGERHVDSGVAAIANATVPLFSLALAVHFSPGERVGGTRLAGVLVGFAGTAVLAGFHPHGGWWAAAGTLAVVVASLAYATGLIYGHSQTRRLAGPVLATTSVLWGAVLLLPLALLQLPEHAPGWKPLASVAALGVAGTGIAQLLLFRMLRMYGSARASLVTYLLPPIALGYGVALLGEALTVEEVAGLALILLGVALASGALGLVRRAPAAEAP